MARNPGSHFIALLHCFFSTYHCGEGQQKLYYIDVNDGCVCKIMFAIRC